MKGDDQRERIIRLLDSLYQKEGGIGSITDVASTDSTSSSTVISLLKGIYQLISTNPTDKYGITNTDTTSSSTHYYGFIDKDGNWYIMQESISGSVSTYSYVVGTTSYSTNWTGRAALTYVEFDLAF